MDYTCENGFICGEGPFVVKIKPFKEKGARVAFSVKIIPCHVFDYESGIEPQVEVEIPNARWFDNPNLDLDDTIDTESEWVESFKTIENLTKKRFFIIEKGSTISVKINLVNYTCNFEDDLDAEFYVYPKGNINQNIVQQTSNAVIVWEHHKLGTWVENQDKFEFLVNEEETVKRKEEKRVKSKRIIDIRRDVDSNERDLEGEQPCDIPDREVCRTIPPTLCPNCFNRGWDPVCFGAVACGNEAAYTWIIQKVVGEYDRRRNKTILRSISGQAINYSRNLETGDTRCYECLYPPLTHDWKVSNNKNEVASGAFKVTTNYECNPDSTGCAGGRWGIIPLLPNGDPIEIDGPGCLATREGCSRDYDFDLEISFSSGGVNSIYMCPDAESIPTPGPKVCGVRYSAGQGSYTGLGPIDFTPAYKWGPHPSLQWPYLNIALRHTTCEVEGCFPEEGSGQRLGGTPGKINVRFGLNTFSAHQVCPC